MHQEEFDIADLDDSWITEFENGDDEYKNYYVEDIFYVKIICLYIHKNEINKIKEEKIYLKQKNHLSREEIISLIKKNSIENNIKYSLLYLLKYNIDLQPLHLKNFLKKKTNPNYYLLSLSNINDINFNASISMFQNLNTLYIIFHKTDDYIKMNVTKKMRVSSYSKRKTIRKQLKEM